MPQGGSRAMADGGEPRGLVGIEADAERRYALDAIDDPRPILVVLHQETSTPGRVGQLLSLIHI